MMSFLLRWFKGIILGWVMSFLFFVVRRMLEKALGAKVPSPADNRRAPPPQPPFPSSPSSSPVSSPEPEIIETLWIGMEEDTLLSSFGSPLSKTRLSDTDEKWTYPAVHGAEGLTEVTLRDGRVTGWA